MASATEAYEQSLFANASVCVGVHVRVPDESSWTHRGQPTAGTPNPHFAQSQSHSSRLQEQAVLEKLRRALRDPTPVTRRHRRRARSKRRARGAREDAGLATGYGTPGAPASPVAPGSAGTGVSSVLGSSQEIQIPEATVGSRPAHRRFLTGRHQSRGWSSPSVPIDGLRAAHGAFKCAKVHRFLRPHQNPRPRNARTVAHGFSLTIGHHGAQSVPLGLYWYATLHQVLQPDSDLETPHVCSVSPVVTPG